MKRKIWIVIVTLLCMVQGIFAVVSDDWQGLYKWVNPTDKNNNGKIVEYSAQVVKTDTSAAWPYEIYYVTDNQRLRLFPLLDEGADFGDWIDFDSPAQYAAAYRQNASVFNTTKVTPSKWRLQSQDYVEGVFVSVITTKAMGLQFTMTSTTSFAKDSKGRKGLLFHMKGTGVASWGLFKNPKPEDLEDNDSFFLVKQ